MTKTIEVREELKKLLNEELTDPRQSSRDKFIKTKRPDNPPNPPYGYITILDAQKEGYSVGQTDRFHRQRMQVTIHVDKTNEFEINGESRSAGYVRHWLAEEADKIIQDNQSRFRDLGSDIYSVLPDSSNPVSPQGTKQVNNDYILRRRRQ